MYVSFTEIQECVEVCHGKIVSKVEKLLDSDIDVPNDLYRLITLLDIVNKKLKNIREKKIEIDS